MNKELVIKTKRSRGEDGTKVFSIRIREDIVKRLDDIAVRSGYSRNELIGLFLEYGLDNCRIEE
ncbi:MAG: CopG family transcriptional regulator [Firmicutes bacterium]|nr:CopG family transcriptional regulator [Bacillota bacterium]